MSTEGKVGHLAITNLAPGRTEQVSISQVITCKAAIAWEAGKSVPSSRQAVQTTASRLTSPDVSVEKPLSIEEVEVSPPKKDEVRIKIL